MRNTSFQELTDTLRSQVPLKSDFVLEASMLAMTGTAEIIVPKMPEWKPLIGTDHFHSQLSKKLEIPSRYYDRMLAKAPSLLATNVNRWLSEQDKPVMIRTLGNKARAFLSNRYNTIDHIDVVVAFVKTMSETGIPFKITGCDLTEKNLTVRVDFPTVVQNAPEFVRNYRNPETGARDARVMSGLVLRNSEVGCGKFSLSPRVVVLACSNGMVLTKENFAVAHLGARLDAGTQMIWSEETDRRNNALIISQISDAVKAFTDPNFLDRQLMTVSEKFSAKVEDAPKKIEVVSKQYMFSKEETARVLDAYIKGGEYDTVGGVVQAFTWYAQRAENSETQYLIERSTLSLVDYLSNTDKKFNIETGAESEDEDAE